MKKLVFVFFSLLVLSSVSFAQPQKIVADKIVGIVGDRIILLSDISNALADIQRQGGTIPPNAECQVMEQALVSKVLMLSALRDSLPLNEEEVEAELDQRIRYFISVYGTKEQLESIAGKTIYQIKDDARESVRENKLAQSMQRKIVDNVKITPAEVKTFFDKVPKDSLPFFESEVEIGQIVVYPKASRDLEKYVMDELANYKRQVESGMISFGQAAKKYSEDPGSKDRDGQYQVNRNDKQWDPLWLSAAFRLKEGEVSNVVKTRFGYHILQMVSRTGDDAVVRHILRVPPVTEVEISESISKLDSVRSKLIVGTMDFNTAAGKYTEDEQAKFAGPFITSRDGDTYNTIDELDKEIVVMLDKLKVGEYSQPVSFTDERGKKGVRILYLKSKSEPHILNLKDDYNKVAQSALEEKKYKALERWLNANIPTYYIMIDEEGGECPQMKKWIDAEKDYAVVD
ncbi:MAG: peptidylprolyl isomerase [Flavisolibacter sp.]|jgi:peptidyl-prolyl cis-trans isomerase SurA|nr:peptidylprolyl isomerase [Flavisolibacter sp.]